MKLILDLPDFSAEETTSKILIEWIEELIKNPPRDTFWRHIDSVSVMQEVEKETT